MSYPHPLIAREGWFFLGAFLLFSIIVTVTMGWLWATPLWLLTLFSLQFFRDPPRALPRIPCHKNDQNMVVCPADGRVVAVEETFDPYLKRQALKVSIFMNVFNVHSNRSPVKGVIKKISYHPGRFFNAALDKASIENERNALWLNLPNGQDIVCVQIAGLIARRILCYAKEGDTLTHGQRYGFIRFGSRVDVYLPLGTSIKVTIGEKVSATTTLLAELT